MPEFNFAKGNARKLLSLPLYALGIGASLVIPRSRDQWVFGSGPGIGEGALELYRLVRVSHPEWRVVWLARDRRDVSAADALGIPAIMKTSLAGLWRTMRARVVVITHGFGDVNRYGTRSAFVVQLWHGVPLKLIQLDSPATMRLGLPGEGRLRGVLRRFYRRGYSAISLFPAASESVATRLRTAFGLDAEVVVTGDPRDDPLSTGTPKERRDTARAAIFGALALPDTGQRSVLFAPTWRDGQVDPAVPSLAEWHSITTWLDATDSLLFVRPHPLGVGDYRPGIDSSTRIFLLGSVLTIGITPALPAFDLLITDYSSVAYDFSLTDGAIFFLAPDEESYTSTRGLYEPYREFSGGREVRDWTALVAQLVRFDENHSFAASIREHTGMLRNRHFVFHDGLNTARVLAEITNRTGVDRR